jgi:hypothetical protein
MKEMHVDFLSFHLRICTPAISVRTQELFRLHTVSKAYDPRMSMYVTNIFENLTAIRIPLSSFYTPSWAYIITTNSN